MSTNNDQLLEVYLQEYQKLKEEQISRIGFRDNLLYVTLAVFGAVLSFALTQTVSYYALLVLPWVCLILGWAYLINDEKISAIGKYIRLKLTDKVMQLTGSPDLETTFGWEIAHRSDKRRSRRKIEQLIIDEITFVISGIAAVVAFWLLTSQISLAIQILCVVEALLLIVLGIEIFIYADLAKGR
ncbi:MAG: hypothetical protein AAF572_29010 [Cyanobacteria bacterium P01_B01_bin.77]